MPCQASFEGLYLMFCSFNVRVSLGAFRVSRNSKSLFLTVLSGKNHATPLNARPVLNLGSQVKWLSTAKRHSIPFYSRMFHVEHNQFCREVFLLAPGCAVSLAVVWGAGARVSVVWANRSWRKKWRSMTCPAFRFSR